MSRAPIGPRVVLAHDALKVYFGDVLHIAVRRSSLLGVQAWHQGHANYEIEFTCAGGSIRGEYANREHWEAIMAGIDALPFLFAAP